MANNSDDIRRLMNLMESVSKEPVLLEGWVDTLKGKLKGNMGEKQRRQMADELAKEWYEWLGKTKRDGTLTDMTRFMTHRIGFNDRDIDHVLGKAGFNAQQVDQAEETGSDEEAEKTIKTGAELKGGKAPENKKPAWDPEEGVPLPDDLNTKLSDYAKYGIDVEQADAKVEPEEIVDDPRKYQDSSGEWNRKLITAKLNKMPMGAKLTLGRSTFSRSVGKDGGTDFYNEPVPGKVKQQESINEADTIEVSDDEVLPKKIVAQIMDASAAQVNDEYLLNGPERDKDNALNQGGKGGRTTYQAGKVPGEEPPASQNVPGKAASGQYNADEMVKILKTDFQITNAKSFVDSLTRKVMNSGSIASMTDNDMHDLALLGWALIRARN